MTLIIRMEQRTADYFAGFKPSLLMTQILWLGNNKCEWSEYSQTSRFSDQLLISSGDCVPELGVIYPQLWHKYPDKEKKNFRESVYFRWCLLSLDKDKAYAWLDLCFDSLLRNSPYLWWAKNVEPGFLSIAQYNRSEHLISTDWRHHLISHLIIFRQL